MMKILIAASIIFVLLSCDKKTATDRVKLDSASLEIIKKDISSRSGSELLGEWTLQLSCDGSIMCNECPRISFNAGGFVTFAGSTQAIVKWEIEDERLKISGLGNGNVIDDGEYAMLFTVDKLVTELELIEGTSSYCYKLTQVND